MSAKTMPAAVVVAVALALGTAPPAVAQAPAGDSVTGDLFDTFATTGTAVFELNARSGAFGENPTGTASWHVGGGLGPTWHVDITCVSVTGRTAVLGFSGTVFFSGELRPTAGLVRIVDGGGPASGLDSFEWAEMQGEPDGSPIPGPTDCSSYPSVFEPSFQKAFNRAGGDIVVTDVNPVPTSKEQCKNGGWKTYGIFKNQGACVSFVATGGKHSPGK